MDFVPNLEESQQPPDCHTPIPIPIDGNAQLQSPDSVPKQADLLHLSHAKKKSKVLRDEEPPAIYSQQRPTGVRKRPQREPPSKSIPRHHQLRTAPEIEDRLYELPPSLVALNAERGKFQPLQMQQAQPGIYRNFGATGERADQRRHELAPQQQPCYPSSFFHTASSNVLPGTYRTFEAKPPPVNNIAAEQGLAGIPQSTRDQFGACSYPENLVPFEQWDSAPVFNHQLPQGFGAASIPPYESPFILTRQAESLFMSAAKEEDVLETFDFDVFLKGDDANG